eukprot:COSAG01_NODE_1871_length_9009_cov_5.036139_8_plen_61_part_00
MTAGRTHARLPPPPPAIISASDLISAWPRAWPQQALTCLTTGLLCRLCVSPGYLTQKCVG